jgi:hypothetical protein
MIVRTIIAWVVILVVAIAIEPYLHRNDEPAPAPATQAPQ